MAAWSLGGHAAATDDPAMRQAVKSPHEERAHVLQPHVLSQVRPPLAQLQQQQQPPQDDPLLALTSLARAAAITDAATNVPGHGGIYPFHLGDFAGSSDLMLGVPLPQQQQLQPLHRQSPQQPQQPQQLPRPSPRSQQQPPPQSQPLQQQPQQQHQQQQEPPMPRTASRSTRHGRTRNEHDATGEVVVERLSHCAVCAQSDRPRIFTLNAFLKKFLGDVLDESRATELHERAGKNPNFLTVCNACYMWAMRTQQRRQQRPSDQDPLSIDMRKVRPPKRRREVQPGPESTFSRDEVPPVGSAHQHQQQQQQQLPVHVAGGHPEVPHHILPRYDGGGGSGGGGGRFLTDATHHGHVEHGIQLPGLHPEPDHHHQ